MAVDESKDCERNRCAHCCTGIDPPKERINQNACRERPDRKKLLYPNRSASNPAIGIVAISRTMQSVLMSKAWGRNNKPQELPV